MNKKVFLDKLRKNLKNFDSQEQEKFINYYEEMVEDYKENGYTEEEAILKIGDPNDIARDILKEQDMIILNIPSTSSKVLNLILLILGFPLWGSLLLCFILLILSAYIIIWCIPVITGSLSIGLFATAIVGIIGSPFVIIKTFCTGIVQFGLGVSSIGFAVLFFMLTIYIGRYFIKITKSFTTKLYNILFKKIIKYQRN